jgi:hypothetical protein
VFYKLEENTPVLCKNAQEWAEWYENAGKRRIVAQDNIGRFLISTVFLGIDVTAARDCDPPFLFETMVFKKDGTDAGMTTRYPTWKEAAAGHRRTMLARTNERPIFVA